MKILNYKEYIKESLLRSKSLKQLEEVKRLSKETDIGNKTDNADYENTIWVKNPINSDLDTFDGE